MTKILNEEQWKTSLPAQHQAVVPGLPVCPAPATVTPLGVVPQVPLVPQLPPGGRGERVSNNQVNAAFTPFRQLSLLPA
jgi:hypothetical protein